MDSDDEVRDRATFYMNVLQQKQKALNAAYIFNGENTHCAPSLNLRALECVDISGPIQEVRLCFLIVVTQTLSVNRHVQRFFFSSSPSNLKMNKCISFIEPVSVCLLPLGLSVSVPGLEKSLHQYTLEPTEKPFDMKSVPLANTPITEQKTEFAPVATSKLPEKPGPTRQDIYQGTVTLLETIMARHGVITRKQNIWSEFLE